MGVELSSDADMLRRIEARRLLEGQRRRVYCKRCRKAIPLERRASALYCSPRCHANCRREEITALRTEMRATARSLLAPAACPCGTPLNNRPGKRGPIGRSCKRCRDRAAQKRRRERLREAGLHARGCVVTDLVLGKS